MSLIRLGYHPTNWRATFNPWCFHGLNIGELIVLIIGLIGALVLPIVCKYFLSAVCTFGLLAYSFLLIGLFSIYYLPVPKKSYTNTYVDSAELNYYYRFIGTGSTLAQISTASNFKFCDFKIPNIILNATLNNVFKLNRKRLKYF